MTNQPEVKPSAYDPLVEGIAGDAGMFAATATPTEMESTHQVVARITQGIISGYEERGTIISPEQKAQIMSKALAALD
jgi:hypothetical protein